MLVKRKTKGVVLRQNFVNVKEKYGENEWQGCAMGLRYGGKPRQTPREGASRCAPRKAGRVIAR